MTVEAVTNLVGCQIPDQYREIFPTAREKTTICGVCHCRDGPVVPSEATDLLSG